MNLIKTNFASKGAIISRIGGRSENQDFFGFRDMPIGQTIVVCDGMGGMQGGQVASTIAVNSILEYLSAVAEDADIPEALTNAVKQANADIINAGNNDSSLYGMGTTVTILVLNETCATAAYVGDSRIYQLRGRKKVFRTFDHSMVFEMVKNGVITEEQARLSEQSNIILKALGVFPDIEPDIHVLPYIKGDRFILCSDGFWGAMPEKEFLCHVSNKGNITNIIEHTANIVEEIGHNKGGNHDNLTAAIIDVECNSLLKEKMSKIVKIVLAALVALLVVSVSLNVYQYTTYTKNTKQAKAQTVESSEAVETAVVAPALGKEEEE